MWLLQPVITRIGILAAVCFLEHHALFAFLIVAMVFGGPTALALALVALFRR